MSFVYRTDILRADASCTADREVAPSLCAAPIKARILPHMPGIQQHPHASNQKPVNGVTYLFTGAPAHVMIVHSTAAASARILGAMIFT